MFKFCGLPAKKELFAVQASTKYALINYTAMTSASYDLVTFAYEVIIR